MARTTPTLVREINGSTLDDAAIQPFIDVASTLIDAAAPCAGVDEATLTQAETYLTCHLMEGADAGGGSGAGNIESETIEEMKSSYSRAAEGGIKSTNYGVVADTLMKGCLSSYEKRRAGIAFTGGA